MAEGKILSSILKPMDIAKVVKKTINDDDEKTNIDITGIDDKKETLEDVAQKIDWNNVTQGSGQTVNQAIEPVRDTLINNAIIANNQLTATPIDLTGSMANQKTSPFTYDMGIASNNINNEFGPQNTEAYPAFNTLGTEQGGDLEELLSIGERQGAINTPAPILRSYINKQLTETPLDPNDTITREKIKKWDDEANQIYEELQKTGDTSLQERGFIGTFQLGVNSIEMGHQNDDLASVLNKETNDIQDTLREELKKKDIDNVIGESIVIDGVEYNLHTFVGGQTNDEAIDALKNALANTDEDTTIKYKFTGNKYSNIAKYWNDDVEVEKEIDIDTLNRISKSFADILGEKSDNEHTKKINEQKNKASELKSKLGFSEDADTLTSEQERHKLEEASMINRGLTRYNNYITPIFDNMNIGENEKAHLRVYVTQQLSKEAADIQTYMNSIDKELDNMRKFGSYTDKQMTELTAMRDSTKRAYQKALDNYADFLAIKTIYGDDEVGLKKKLYELRTGIDTSGYSDYEKKVAYGKDVAYETTFLMNGVYDELPTSVVGQVLKTSAFTDYANQLKSIRGNMQTVIDGYKYDAGYNDIWEMSKDFVTYAADVVGDTREHWLKFPPSMMASTIGQGNNLASGVTEDDLISDDFKIKSGLTEAFYMVESVLPEFLAILRGNKKFDKIIDPLMKKATIKSSTTFTNMINRTYKSIKGTEMNANKLAAMEGTIMKTMNKGFSVLGEIAKNEIGDLVIFNGMDTSAWDYEEQRYWTNIGNLITIGTSGIVGAILDGGRKGVDMIRNGKKNLMGTDFDALRYLNDNPESFGKMVYTATGKDWKALTGDEKLAFSIAATDAVKSSIIVLNALKNDDTLKKVIEKTQKGYAGTMLDTLLNGSNSANRTFIINAAEDAGYKLADVVKKVGEVPGKVIAGDGVSNLFTKLDASLLQSVNYDRALDVVSEGGHFNPTKNWTKKEIVEFGEKTKDALSGIQKVFSEDGISEFFKKVGDNYVLNNDGLNALGYNTKKLDPNKLGKTSKDTSDFVDRLKKLNEDNKDVGIELVPEKLINDIESTDAFSRISAELGDIVCGIK